MRYCIKPFRRSSFVALDNLAERMFIQNNSNKIKIENKKVILCVEQDSSRSKNKHYLCENIDFKIPFFSVNERGMSYY